MATIAIRRNTVQALTTNQRKIVRHVFLKLDLNDPASFIDTNGVHWFVFDDPRISLDDIAVIGTLIRLVSNAAVTNYDPSDDSPNRVRVKIRQILQNQVVRANTVQVLPEADAFATVLAAQNAPVVIRAMISIPGDWTPE